MKLKNKRCVSWFLAFCMVLICALVPGAGADAAENEAKIGETEYATLGEAIDASKDGDTITILRDLTLTFRGSSNQRILVLKEVLPPQ